MTDKEDRTLEIPAVMEDAPDFWRNFMEPITRSRAFHQAGMGDRFRVILDAVRENNGTLVLGTGSDAHRVEFDTPEDMVMFVMKWS